MKRAYVGSTLTNPHVYQTLLSYGVDSLHTDITELMTALQPGEDLIIHDLMHLPISPKELLDKETYLANNGITLHIIETFDVGTQTYLDIIRSAFEAETLWRSTKTKKGIDKAKQIGKIGGRPRLSDKLVKEIEYLARQSYTMREISGKTGVSIGTAYKYASKYKKSSSGKETNDSQAAKLTIT